MCCSLTITRPSFSRGKQADPTETRRGTSSIGFVSDLILNKTQSSTGSGEGVVVGGGGGGGGKCMVEVVKLLVVVVVKKWLWWCW